MTGKRESDFVEQVKRQLDADAEGLDALTLARLRAARLRALDQAPRRWSFWLPVFGTATVAVLALVVMLWPATSDLRTPLDDWDIVAAQEPLDLIDDYEFYEWLETADSSS